MRRLSVTLLAAVGLVTYAPITMASNRPAESASTSTSADVGLATVSVASSASRSVDGSTTTTFTLPSGSVITTVTPPAGFNPLKASNDELVKYGFPLPPSDADDYAAWYAAMAAFRSDDPPTGALTVTPDAPRYATQYNIWGGYSAGTLDVQSQKYVAVKANLTVPSNVGTCSVSNGVGFWIGLGGTGGTYEPNNLAQQGIGCGNPGLGTGSAYRAWTEFANTDPPIPFCGISWTLAAGHVIYQNMSFQTSTNKAFWYMEDQTAGVAHSCSQTAPSGWHWDLNTAEWEGEAPANVAIDFDHVHFTNARAELFSNSTWVTLGSQSVTTWIDGDDPVNPHHLECMRPGAISSGTVFDLNRTGSQCHYTGP